MICSNEVNSIKVSFNSVADFVRLGGGGGRGGVVVGGKTENATISKGDVAISCTPISWEDQLKKCISMEELQEMSVADSNKLISMHLSLSSTNKNGKFKKWVGRQLQRRYEMIDESYPQLTDIEQESRQEMKIFVDEFF